MKIIDTFDIPARSKSFSAIIEAEKLLNSSIVILSFGDELYNGNSGSFTFSINDKDVYTITSLSYGSTEFKLFVVLLYCGNESVCFYKWYTNFSGKESSDIGTPKQSSISSTRDTLTIKLESTGQFSFGDKLEVYSL